MNYSGNEGFWGVVWNVAYIVAFCKWYNEGFFFGNLQLFKTFLLFELLEILVFHQVHMLHSINLVWHIFVHYQEIIKEDTYTLLAWTRQYVRPSVTKNWVITIKSVIVVMPVWLTVGDRGNVCFMEGRWLSRFVKQHKNSLYVRIVCVWPVLL